MALSDRTLRQLEWATGRLATDVVARMEAELPWFAALGADQRAAVGLIAQSGVREFVRWSRAYQDAGGGEPLGGGESTEDNAPAPGGGGDGGHLPASAAAPPLRTADLFGTAPRQLVRAISLRQTVTLVRMAVETCERQLERMLTEDDESQGARVLLLRYAREVAFAAADVYARAAETRGAWDARLESLVVDAVVRGDASDVLASQASALSWQADRPTTVVVADTASDEASPAAWRRVARHHDTEIITGRHGTRVVCVVGGPADALPVATALLPLVGDGPVVVGPTHRGLATAGASAQVALSGIVAVRAWPEAPRPVLAAALLPERVLAGEPRARQELVETVHRPLAEAGGDLLPTLASYLANGATLEATARQLFVHPNTVRYRLGRVTDVTGLRPGQPRDRWILQLGLATARLDAPEAAPAPSPGRATGGVRSA